MFWAEIWKISEFFIWKILFFLVVKFSVYLNRRVFVMHCLCLYQHQIHCILVVMPPKRSGANPESILYKTISGRYRAYPDELKTARYRFKKNASWEKNCMKTIFTMLRASELFIVLGNLEKQMCNVRNLEPKWWTSEETAGLYTTACMIVLQAEWTVRTASERQKRTTNE